MLGIASHFPTPTLMPIGDSAILVRFGTVMGDDANNAAIALALALDRAPISGVVEVTPNLVSVMLRYDPQTTSSEMIEGQLRLLISSLSDVPQAARLWSVPVIFDGVDLDETASSLGLTTEDFVSRHCAKPLRVLATGFAPGFVYCGMHDGLTLPRRPNVRSAVPAGTILFAAGQTAITATEIPTGWHVIGHTQFRNLDLSSDTPTQMTAGDHVQFSEAL